MDHVEKIYELILIFNHEHKNDLLTFKISIILHSQVLNGVLTCRYLNNKMICITHINKYISRREKQ